MLRGKMLLLFRIILSVALFQQVVISLPVTAGKNKVQLRTTPTSEETSQSVFVGDIWTCNNLCTFGAHNGVCEDGGPGADYAWCMYGSDCADCGIRDPGTRRPTTVRTRRPTPSLSEQSPTTAAPTVMSSSAPTKKHTPRPSYPKEDTQQRTTPSPSTKSPSATLFPTSTKFPTASAYPSRQPSAMPSSSPTATPSQSPSTSRPSREPSPASTRYPTQRPVTMFPSVPQATLYPTPYRKYKNPKRDTGRRARRLNLRQEAGEGR